MSLPSTHRSGYASSIPASAIESLPLSHPDEAIYQRRPIGDFRGHEKSVIPVCDLGNMRGLDKDVIKAFFDIKEQIANKFKGLPNEKEVLDLCEVFRVGLCDIIAREFNHNSDFIQRFGREDPTAVQPSSLVKVRLRDDAAENYSRHIAHLSLLTPEIMLKDVRSLLDEYLRHKPAFGCSFLVEFVKIVRVVFPCDYDYEVVLEKREMGEVVYDCATVIKRDAASSKRQVVLVVMGQLPAKTRKDFTVVENSVEYYCFCLAQSVINAGVTQIPQHVFWLGFHGVHFGYGWYQDHVPERLWPADDYNYQDIRSPTGAMGLIGFAKQVAGHAKSRAELLDLAGELGRSYPPDQ